MIAVKTVRSFVMEHEDLFVISTFTKETDKSKQ